MTFDQPTGIAPSTADVKAAIRETRQKLADHVALTADHVHRIFTTPGSVETEAPLLLPSRRSPSPAAPGASGSTPKEWAACVEQRSAG